MTRGLLLSVSFIVALIVAICWVTISRLSANDEHFSNQPRVMNYMEFEQNINWNIVEEHARIRRIPPLYFRTSQDSLQDLSPKLVKILYDALDKSKGQLVYFDDRDMETFIRDKYPEYLDVFKKLIPKAYQSDLWRLLVIYHYGGMYTDMTMSFLVDPKTITHDKEAVMCKDWTGQPVPAMYNAFIAAYPRHPFIKAYIESLAKNVRESFYGTGPLDVTGPFEMARAYNRFFGFPIDQHIKSGDMERNGYRVTVLYLHADKYNFNHDGAVIVNDKNEDLIRTKTKGHYDLIYKNGRVHYSVLWHKRAIYN